MAEPQVHADARIHEGAIVGAPPFWFPRCPDGSRPRAGIGGAGILIEKDVDVFPMAQVVDGSKRSTVIRQGSRIGPRAQIGHDTQIGRHCCIGAGSIVCGFAEIGDCTTLGVGVTVVPFVKVGRNCFIMAGAVVVKDVPDNSVMAGVPATFKRENPPLAIPADSL